MFAAVILLAAVLFVLICGKAYRWLVLPLVLAFSIRTGLMVGEYAGLWVTPGNGEDSVRFIGMAIYWSSLFWTQLLEAFNPSASYVYSWVGALLFKCVGYHELILPSVNLFAGVATVFFAGRIAQILWDRSAGRWAAMVIALFPFEVFNSVAVLREELPILSFAVGIFFVVRWGAGAGLGALVLSMLAFGVATLFHSGWLAAITGLSAYLLFSSLRTSVISIRTRRMQRAAFQQLVFSIALLIPSLILLPYTDLSLSKGINFGSLDLASMGEKIDAAFEGSRGGSAYPAFISQGNPFTSPWLIPAKFIYFLYSPFPWDITAARHLAGIVAGMMFLWLTLRIYRLRSVLFRRRETMAILLIVGAVVLAFSIGTNNVGTSIRHRTKVLVGLVVIAAGRSMVRERRESALGTDRGADRRALRSMEDRWRG